MTKQGRVQLATCVLIALGTAVYSYKCNTARATAALKQDAVALLPQSIPNQLTAEEKAAGWQLLFDGQTFAGWTLADGSPVTRTWTIQDGAIATAAATQFRSDLISDIRVRDFDLVFEFRLSPGANSGVKYFVGHTMRYLGPSSIEGSLAAAGLEFQLIDDASKDAVTPVQKMGALYGLLPPESPARYNLSGWNQARIVCRESRCEHWINGRRVVSFRLDSSQLQQQLTDAAVNKEQSIISSLGALVIRRRSDFPTAIALQHHSSKVWFRSLKLLDPAKSKPL